MTIDAVVFDMDGLMLDTEPLYKEIWQRTAAELGYHLNDAAYARLIGLPKDASEAALVAQFGATFPLDAFRERWPPIWRARAKGGIAIKRGLLDLLALLTERGVPIAVATSSEAEYASVSLEATGLAGRFAAIVTCDQPPTANRRRMSTSKQLDGLAWRRRDALRSKTPKPESPRRRPPAWPRCSSPT